MKRLASVMMGLCVGTAMRVWAQEGAEPPRDESRPPRGERRAEDRQPLTEAQQALVKSILSKYDPKTLTADQARAIHEAFRQAGLRGGPAMGEAIRAAGFDPEKLRDLAPPPTSRRGEAKPEDRPRGGGGGPRGPETEEGGPGDEGGPGPGGGPGDRSDQGQPSGQNARRGQGQYSLAQAMSDRAQLSTIAFSGLAFVTGDFGPDTFLPPGKVCDFFGFQYMRDIDAAGKGHNPMFLDRVAGNVLKILTAEQRKAFEDLAKEQAPKFNELALKRFPVIKAFCRELKGDIPAGSAGLNRDAVRQYVGELFAFDAELAYERARVFGKIAVALTAEQKAVLGKMKFGDFNTWPAVDMDAYKLPKGTDKSLNVAYMTYASEFFSWYAGSVEADVYFCPERHGTYFGGFYMKDMPAMGKKDYDISTAITGDSGEMFLKLLTAEQRAPIAAIPDAQRKDLQEIISVRQAISTELRQFLKGETPGKEKVLALGRRYGELDGDMSWMYATAFSKANKTLSSGQRTALQKLRNLDGYTSAPAYLYSTPMQTLPAISETDVFFAVPAGKSTTLPAASGAVAPASSAAGFVLKSPAVPDGGPLPKEYTGDGESATLPLEWTGAPDGVRSFAVIMHHVDPEGRIKWYWTLYNIPAGTCVLPKNVKNVGICGNNSVNGRADYAPPHSKGPGAKTYVYTVYALSAPVTPDVPAAQVSREVLLAAMKDKILATAEMNVVYTRAVEKTGQGEQLTRESHN